MPAEIVHAADCASLWGVYEVPSDSDPEKKYRVTLYGESAATCNCKAYEFFKGDAWDRTCKHINQVWNGACKYNINWGTGCEKPAFRPVAYSSPHIIEGKSCPSCGGPVVAVRRAV